MTKTANPPAAKAGTYRCDACIDLFPAYDGCEDLQDLRDRREGPAMRPTPATRRSLRAHIRTCGWCKAEATKGEHHPYCPHAEEEPQGINRNTAAEQGRIIEQGVIIEYGPGDDDPIRYYPDPPSDPTPKPQDDQDEEPTLACDRPFAEQVAEWITAQGGTVTYAEAHAQWFTWRIREALDAGTVRKVTNAAWNYQLLTTRPPDDQDNDPEGGNPPTGSTPTKEEAMNTNTAEERITAWKAQEHARCTAAADAAASKSLDQVEGYWRDRATRHAPAQEEGMNRNTAAEQPAPRPEHDRNTYWPGMPADLLDQQIDQEIDRRKAAQDDPCTCGAGTTPDDDPTFTHLAGCGTHTNPAAAARYRAAQAQDASPDYPCECAADITPHAEWCPAREPYAYPHTDNAGRTWLMTPHGSVRVHDHEEEEPHAEEEEPQVEVDRWGRAWIITPQGASRAYYADPPEWNPCTTPACTQPVCDTYHITPRRAIHWWQAIAHTAGDHLTAARTRQAQAPGPDNPPPEPKTNPQEDLMNTNTAAYQITERPEGGGWTVSHPQGKIEHPTAHAAQAWVLGIEETLTRETNTDHRTAVIEWQAHTPAGRAVVKTLVAQPAPPDPHARLEEEPQDDRMNTNTAAAQDNPPAEEEEPQDNPPPDAAETSWRVMETYPERTPSLHGRGTAPSLRDAITQATLKVAGMAGKPQDQVWAEWKRNRTARTQAPGRILTAELDQDHGRWADLMDSVMPAHEEEPQAQESPAHARQR